MDGETCEAPLKKPCKRRSDSESAKLQGSARALLVKKPWVAIFAKADYRKQSRWPAVED
jgi:hypothetical protein